MACMNFGNSTRLLYLLTILLLIQVTKSQRKQSCSSPIFCQGPILHVVQTSGIYNDSKTFVDMRMIYPINETLENFDLFMTQCDYKPSKDEIAEFVVDNFEARGELEEYYPPDYKPLPRIIKEIDDAVVRDFTKHLIQIWPTLGRKVTREVLENPEVHSIIPVNHGFIIPGGRFKELYYWDSYWIVKGLLICEMTETARGMIDNLLSMVERYGFVPNGGRIYYLNRSQPPLLTMMVAEFYRYTKDVHWLRTNVKTLDKELKFWVEKRTTEIEKDGVTYILAHFDSESDTPRPESYTEDLETCSFFTKEDDRYECYTELKGGAESGWDFTSRWIFDKVGGINANLTHIQTRRNIPVDLNSFLYKAFTEMVNFYTILNSHKFVKMYEERAQQWKIAINKILFDPSDNVWYDYDVKLGKRRKRFYPSNLTPLWAEAFDQSDKQKLGGAAVEYLKAQGVLDFKGGIPSSLINSGEQWDYPNAWSPIQAIVIFGLEQSENKEAIALARELAIKWVRSNMKAYYENRVMFEKYNAANVGQFGGGGEYHIQAGFGWSNGVILEFINYFFRIKTRKSKV